MKQEANEGQIVDNEKPVPEIKEKVYFKKNQLKKTRSKQKNKKKDNRPLEERRHKLLQKGIII